MKFDVKVWNTNNTKTIKTFDNKMDAIKFVEKKMGIVITDTDWTNKWGFTNNFGEDGIDIVRRRKANAIKKMTIRGRVKTLIKHGNIIVWDFQ